MEQQKDFLPLIIQDAVPKWQITADIFTLLENYLPEDPKCFWDCEYCHIKQRQK
jgi:hypothetical protein